MKAKERKRQEKEQVMAKQLREILGDEDILEEKRLKTAERVKVMQFKVKSLQNDFIDEETLHWQNERALRNRLYAIFKTEPSVIHPKAIEKWKEFGKFKMLQLLDEGMLTLNVKIKIERIETDEFVY